jgi:hypothetical protein
VTLVGSDDGNPDYQLVNWRDLGQLTYQSSKVFWCHPPTSSPDSTDQALTFLCTSVSDLTGRSNVNRVLDNGEKETATTPDWEISRAAWVEVDAEGRRCTLCRQPERLSSVRCGRLTSKLRRRHTIVHRASILDIVQPWYP